ncbi:MAG: TetR/AcrR family transcriptional regulator [Spirochaetaceae bacterium]|nr:TetR/AcrR family transcriptional regulator [Spirochaetaceae bacterium]
MTMRDAKVPAKLGRPSKVAGERPTKARIFDAAVELFAERGFDGTSVRAIAGAVSLTESAVYRHYRDKDAILDAICDYMATIIFSPLPVEGTRGSPGEDSIFRGLLAPLPRIVLSDPYMAKISRIFYAEMSHNAKIRSYLREAYGERGQGLLESLFARFAEMGVLRPCDTAALARAFNAFRIDWVFENFIVGRNETLGVEALERGLEPVIRLFEEAFLAQRSAR